MAYQVQVYFRKLLIHLTQVLFISPHSQSWKSRWVIGSFGFIYNILFLDSAFYAFLLMNLGYMCVICVKTSHLYLVRQFVIPATYPKCGTQFYTVLSPNKHSCGLQLMVCMEHTNEAVALQILHVIRVYFIQCIFMKVTPHERIFYWHSENVHFCMCKHEMYQVRDHSLRLTLYTCESP